MPLFESIEDPNINPSTRRRSFTKEKGTSTVIAGFVAILLIYTVGGQIQDHILLSKKWPPLKPNLNGLTVIGALNPPGSYNRNVFKVTTETGESRLALTQYGWNTIFDENNGPLCNQTTASEIRSALNTDDLAGEAMLRPFVRAEVQVMLAKEGNGGDPKAFMSLSDNTPITIPPETTHGSVTHTTLGVQLKRFDSSNQQSMSGQSESTGSGGSESGRSVEQLIYLSPDTAASVMPVVMTGRQFTSCWVEEEPPNLITGTEYTIWLNLTEEGRSRFFQWSHNHMGEDLLFILNHQYLTIGHISEILDTTNWGIQNCPDKGTADQLMNYIQNENKNRR